MHVTILGAGGFLGARLAAELARDGRVGDTPVASLTLFDLHAPKPPATAAMPVRCLGGDVADPAALGAAIPPGTGLVFHLAAVVSAQAEADLDLGLRVNLHGTLALLQACRALPAPPRVVFTSSVAAFAGGQDAVLADDARSVPGNSYGAQKACGELLLADASRRGLLDAISLRLPTVIVRPGRPNRAASSFVSAILREPLLGLETDLPVPPEFALWVCSPRSAVDWLRHAAVVDTAGWGADRGINPPGRRVTVAELLAALETVAGPAARALVRVAPDPAIAAIVGGWPATFTATRARALGFAEEADAQAILRAFIADDLAATRAERGS